MTRHEPNAQADLAFERWGAGDFEAAAELYAQVVTTTAPHNYNLPTYLASYAAVLAELSRHDEARASYERAVAAELALGSPEESAPVAVARYFLAEHALRVSEPKRALEAVSPSLGTTT
jgi:tetratricopeptide (TPR) repeat protein